METKAILERFGALAHEGRAALFRQIVRAGPEGVCAGEACRSLDLALTTGSAQLAVLERAGLIRGERCGRVVIYRAELHAVGAMMGFLLEDCCQGRPEACAEAAAIVQRASICC